MPHYRIYLLDNTGRIASGSDGEFNTDEEAYAAAQQTAIDAGVVEVWNGTRYVGRIAPTASNGRN